MIIWKRWCCWLLVEVFLHQLYATSSITRVDRFLVWVVTAFGFGRGIQCNKYGRSYVCRCIWSILTNTQINPSSKRQIIQRLGSQLNNTEITWQQQVVWCRASQMSPAGQTHQQKSWGLLVPPWTWAVRADMLSAAKARATTTPRTKRRFNTHLWFRIHAKAFCQSKNLMEST